MAPLQKWSRCLSILIAIQMATLAETHLVAIAARARVAASDNRVIIAKTTRVHSFVFKISILMTVRTEKSFVTFQTKVLVLFCDGLVPIDPVQLVVVGFDLRKVFVTRDAFETSGFGDF